MRFRALAVASGLGVLAATPCLALTIQAAPPTPDVAQHLRATAPTAMFGVLPAPDQLKDSFAASGRAQLGQGFYAYPDSARSTSFSFGPFRGAATMAPGYGAYWNRQGLRDAGNPLSLTPPGR
jgi:hypothetical protein